MNQVFDWLGRGGNAAFVASVLSLIAIGISLVAAFKSHGTAKRLVDIEEAREQDRILRSRKADLTAKIAKEEPPRAAPPRAHRKYYLVIGNAGPADAKDVSFLLGDKPAMESGLIENPKEEIHEIRAKQSCRYELRHRPQDGLLAVRISWRDDSGELQTRVSRLTV